MQEGDAEVAEFIARYGLEYPFLMDRTGEVSTTYGVVTTPTAFFIAPDGTIVDQLDGLMTERWLTSNIEPFIDV